MIERLPQDLEEVLAPERALPPLDDAVRARIEARLAASLGAPITTDLPQETVATPGVDTPPRPPGLPGWLWKVGLAMLAVTGVALVVGSRDDRRAAVAARAAESARLPDDAARVEAAEAGKHDEAGEGSTPAVASVNAASSTDAASVIDINDLPDAAPIRSSATRAAPGSSSVATATDESLRRERALTDAARTSIGLGDGLGALDKLKAASAQFPAGQLIQEREALAVQALWTSGQHQQAKERAQAFRERFPSSPLLHSVEALVGPHPVAQP